MPVLAVAVTLLLGGGVLGATTVEPTRPADGRVASLGLGDASLIDDERAASQPVVVAAPDSTAPPAPSTTVPTTSSTRVAPATTTTTSTPKGGPTTTAPVATTVTTMAPASSWRAEGEGVSARMRMEPANPVAGQPVRFSIEYSGELACCYLFLHFGDDERFSLNNDWLCQGPNPLSPGAHRTVTTHTYARPGAYRVWLQVMDGDLCTLPSAPELQDPALLEHLDLHACVSVGPRNAADGGCEPAPNPFPFLPPPR